MRGKTIDSYLMGLRSHHIDLDYSDNDLNAFANPILKRIIAGIRRRNGEAGTLERTSITRDILLQLLSKLHQSNRDQANIHAAFSLAFAGFLRLDEITYTATDLASDDFSQWHVTRASMKLRATYMELHLPASKTDPWRQGVSISIAATGDNACPIRSLQHLFNIHPAPPEAPLF